MEFSSIRTKQESISSLQSTIRKSETALAKLTAQGSNTTLIRKRLKAFQVALAAFDTIWNQSSLAFGRGDLVEAQLVLSGLFPSLRAAYSKLEAGKSQQTLLKRRIVAQELALLAIEELLRDRV